MLFGILNSLKSFLAGFGQPLVKAAATSLVAVIVLTFLYHSLPFAMNTALVNYLPLVIGFALYQHVWVRLRDRRRPGRTARPATARR
jgi:hypothetical protein